MKALIFPGQGSQIVGMGSEFYRDFKIAREIFTEADDVLKYKISKIILEGPDDQLKLTKNTQPAILTVSYLIFLLLKKEFGINLNQCKYFAGHSLGEYSALVCSNSLKFKDALYLLHERGIAMQEAVPVGVGAMAAILGLDFEAVTAVAAAASQGEVCEAANDNDPGQVVVSGQKAAVERALVLAKEAGAKRAVLLPVSAPFHCALMEPAAARMEKALSEVEVLVPILPLIANVNATAVSDPPTIKSLLIQQVTGSVRWRESIMYLAAVGVTEIWEIGAGKALSGMVRRIDRTLNCQTIGSPEDIAKVLMI